MSTGTVALPMLIVLREHVFGSQIVVHRRGMVMQTRCYGHSVFIIGLHHFFLSQTSSDGMDGNL